MAYGMRTLVDAATEPMMGVGRPPVMIELSLSLGRDMVYATPASDPANTVPMARTGGIKFIAATISVMTAVNNKGRIRHGHIHACVYGRPRGLRTAVKIEKI